MGEVHLQFDCTRDLYSVSAGEVLILLPKEFDKFKSGWQSTLLSKSHNNKQ